MSQQNVKGAVNTPAAESEESSFSTARPEESISYAAIRRAMRRSIFIDGHAQFNVNTAAFRTAFDMPLDYLAAATFTHDEAVFGTATFRSSIELQLINPNEKLLITVALLAPKAGAEPEMYETRIVHSANPIGDEEHEENIEYQTTNIYKSSGALNQEARNLFWSEHDGLKNYAQANLPKGDEYSPFCQWQYSRLIG